MSFETSLTNLNATQDQIDESDNYQIFEHVGPGIPEEHKEDKDYEIVKSELEVIESMVKVRCCTVI